MLVLRTSNFQGATIRPIVPQQQHSGRDAVCALNYAIVKIKLDDNAVYS